MSKFSKIFFSLPIIRLIFSGTLNKIGFGVAIFLSILLSFSIKAEGNRPFISAYLLNNNVSEFPVYLSQNRAFVEGLPYESFENTIASVSSPSTITPSLMAVVTSGSNTGSSVIRDYVVKEGDTLSSIAQKFGISVETIKNTNKIGDKIYPGQKLIILPVDGLIHEVKEGDTVFELAKLYQAKVEDIIAFNDLSPDGKIYIGDNLIIPYGKMPSYEFIAPEKVVKIANGYFICPISKPCTITQGLHWYNAVDISHGRCGEPVFAAAGGIVIKAKTTQSRSPEVFGGMGNHVRILHPNGITTTYGHLQSVLVYEGQKVSQGQIIGLMGGVPGTPGAGTTTGCHVHFAVGGASNPFAK